MSVSREQYVKVVGFTGDGKESLYPWSPAVVRWRISYSSNGWAYSNAFIIHVESRDQAEAIYGAIDRAFAAGYVRAQEVIRNAIGA